MRSLIVVMDEILATLDDREQKVLKYRFGLEDGCSKILEESGREYGVTRERIRQIEDNAFRKLRHPSRSGKLHWLEIIAEDRRLPGLNGYVKLQAAILGIDVEDFYRGYGLLCFIHDDRRKCKSCGKPIDEQYYWYCTKCRYVPVACEYCGKVVNRKRQEVIAAAKRGAKHQFCSKRCHGYWVATYHGFVAHPENIVRH